MKEPPENVVQAALALPAEARAALAGRLLDSLDEVDEDAEAAWDAEIARRLGEIDSGAARGVPWLEARRRILG